MLTVAQIPQVARLLPYWTQALATDSGARWALLLNLACLFWLKNGEGHNDD